MSSDDITISWIRHGESMAQMMENAIDDQYKDEEDKKRFKNYRIKVKTEEIEQYRTNDFIFDIEHAYEAFKEVKQVQNKIEINKQLKFRDENKDEVNNFINDKKINDEGEVDYAYLYDKLTPASWFLTPTLTYAGKIQAETLGSSKFFENYKEDDTLFICSPTVRTIMTALYALHSSKIDPKPTIHIVPYINEKGMDTDYLDRANAGIPYEIINKVVEMIKKYISIKNIHVETMKYIETAKASLKKKENIYLGDFNEAKIHIKKLLHGKIKVAAFVHASFIINRIGEAEYKLPRDEFPNNCNVYQLNYDEDINPKPIALIKPAYEGGVRNKKLLTVEEEEQNIDFSSLKKSELRGDINRKWIKCYDINNGHYKCGGDVVGLKEQFDKTGGKRKTKRRNKKYTSKKRRLTRKKTKRNLRRRRR